MGYPLIMNLIVGRVWSRESCACTMHRRHELADRDPRHVRPGDPRFWSRFRSSRTLSLHALCCYRCQWCLPDALQFVKRAMGTCACLVCGYWSRQDGVRTPYLTLITRTKGSRRSCDLLRHDLYHRAFRSRPDRATDMIHPDATDSSTAAWTAA